jgi:hypothetical protein
MLDLPFRGRRTAPNKEPRTPHVRRTGSGDGRWIVRESNSRPHPACAESTLVARPRLPGPIRIGPLLMHVHSISASSGGTEAKNDGQVRNSYVVSLALRIGHLEYGHMGRACRGAGAARCGPGWSWIPGRLSDAPRATRSMGCLFGVLAYGMVGQCHRGSSYAEEESRTQDGPYRGERGCEAHPKDGWWTRRLRMEGQE